MTRKEDVCEGQRERKMGERSRVKRGRVMRREEGKEDG